MNDFAITLSRLVTQTQTASAQDLNAMPRLRNHAGMFMVIQGKMGLKLAREWLLGAALLDLHRQATGTSQKTND